MNFSNKCPYLTTVFISNISLEIVRVIAGTRGTNNIAAKLQTQRGADKPFHQLNTSSSK